ncbi:hypothetical protein ASB57_13455 [Bordetella sp. N]|nr:hypothetical protein ASB57_13455 [Bordetella sp. N]
MALGVSLTGCVNFYSDYYRQANGMDVTAIKANRAAPPPEDPIVERVAPPVTPEQQTAFFYGYAKRGYSLLGYSSFHTTRSTINDQLAVKQAKELQADLVAIYNPRYTGSTTQTETRTVPVSSTTTDVENESKTKGPRGTTKTTDKTSVTTTVTATELVNVSYDHYMYGASYFVRQKPGLGILMRDLDDNERKALQTNKGIHILVVVNDSPAFHADILVDDVILTMNGQAVIPADFRALVAAAAGQNVTLQIVRNGKKLTKTIPLPAAAPPPSAGA